ncbi:DNA-3-methyladenine glycosylase [Caldicellulosiruptoraceae bacterium PP1]
MQIKEYNKFIKISGESFDLASTFESGQCFRWNAIDKDTYLGVVNSKAVLITKNEDQSVDIYNVSPDEFKKYFYWYFDFDKDYNQIIDELIGKDKILQKAVLKYNGMRLLNQEPFECMISFIISQNNNIKRIKGIIERLCERYGRQIIFNQNILYSFPEPEDLKDVKLEDLLSIGLGYRAEYVIDAVKKVLDGEIILEELEEVEYEQAKKELKKIKGIGDKVADCILLYSLKKYNSFPLDVWTKRVLNNLYGFKSKYDIETFIKSLGEYAGYAQLFLFHYIRMNGGML